MATSEGQGSIRDFMKPVCVIGPDGGVSLEGCDLWCGVDFTLLQLPTLYIRKQDLGKQIFISNAAEQYIITHFNRRTDKNKIFYTLDHNAPGSTMRLPDPPYTSGHYTKMGGIKIPYLNKTMFTHHVPIIVPDWWE